LDLFPNTTLLVYQKAEHLKISTPEFNKKKYHILDIELDLKEKNNKANSFLPLQNISAYIYLKPTEYAQIINEQLVWLYPHFYTKHTNNIARIKDSCFVEVDKFSTVYLDSLKQNQLESYLQSSKLLSIKERIMRLASQNCFDDFYNETGIFRLPTQDSLELIAQGKTRRASVIKPILSTSIIDYPAYSVEVARHKGQAWTVLRASYPTSYTVNKDKVLSITQYIDTLPYQVLKYNQLNVKWDFLIKTFPGMLDAFVSNRYIGIYAYDGNVRVLDLYSLKTGVRIGQYRLKENEHIVGAYWTSCGTPLP